LLCRCFDNAPSAVNQNKNTQKVGSVREEDHERGLAHVLEHLAFNATENHDSHAIVALLEALGAPFGACQVARLLLLLLLRRRVGGRHRGGGQPQKSLQQYASQPTSHTQLKQPQHNSH
jgi:hypothetical protein